MYRVHFYSLSDRRTVSLDDDPKLADQKHRIPGLLGAGDNRPLSPGSRLTTIGLCGLGIILVGTGMRHGATERWWVPLAHNGMLILIIAMGMFQERWITREQHRLIVSALKRIGEPGRSGKRMPRRKRSRRGGKPPSARSSPGS